MKTKIILSLMVLFCSVSYSDTLDDFYASEQAHQLKRLADAAETQNALSGPTYVPVVRYVNEAGEGCQWAKITDGNGKQKTAATKDGKIHKLYVKVCEDDPEIEK